MIISLLSLILFIIFTILSAIHFYWLFGGKWGLKQAIPSKENEPNSLMIPQFATLIVALLLFAFGSVYFVKAGLSSLQFINSLNKYAFWIIPILFTLRAIGEFNYVGFFKKIKHTEFARADSKIFSPLCLGIGVIGFIIQLMD